MAISKGKVVSLTLSRRLGKVTLRSYSLGGNLGNLTQKEINEYFVLYNDGHSSVTIDPTEMVKRNWLISSLQQALRTKVDVTISYNNGTHAVVSGVTLTESD